MKNTKCKQCAEIYRQIKAKKVEAVFKNKCTFKQRLPCVPRISMCRCASPLAADRASLIMTSVVTA